MKNMVMMAEELRTLLLLIRITELWLIFTTPELLPTLHKVNTKDKTKPSYPLLFRGKMFRIDLDAMLRFEFTNETGIP